MIAISVTVHENPRVLMELVSNLDYCYSGNLIIVAHLSTTSREAFLKQAAADGVRAKCKTLSLEHSASRNEVGKHPAYDTFKLSIS